MYNCITQIYHIIMEFTVQSSQEMTGPVKNDVAQKAGYQLVYRNCSQYYPLVIQDMYGTLWNHGPLKGQ